LKKDSQFKELLKELSRDPRLKRVIANADPVERKAAKSNRRGYRPDSLGNCFPLNDQEEGRALEELMDAIYLLVQVSLLLKENVFDRPEVKRFFRQRSKQIYSLVQEYVVMILPRTKGVHRTRKPRSA